MNKNILFIYFLMLASIICFGEKQKDIVTNAIKATKSTTKIVVDGILNEEIWDKSMIADHFWNHYPIDSTQAKNQSIVRVLYDDEYIYFGIICFDDIGNYVTQTLKRDNINNNNFWYTDGFTIILDPGNNRTNGYLFGVSTEGVQADGLLSFGEGVTQVNENWDTKWYSDVKINPGNFTIEIAIPFKIINYNPTQTTWGINFARTDFSNNIWSSWQKVSRNLVVYDLNFIGSIEFPILTKSTQKNITVIPYGLGGIINKNVADQSSSFEGEIGIDAKIKLGFSTNLDLTINPDFSQVGVDDQIINLTRFDIYYPERRTFFLENSDLFANTGSSLVRPFFSRMIGSDDGKTVPLLSGIRLSGNISNNTRFGMMNVLTGSKSSEHNINYSVFAIQSKTSSQSFMKWIFVNKQDVKDFKFQKSAYNRIAGVQFTQTNKSGKLRIESMFYKSMSPDYKDKNNFLHINNVYSSSNLESEVSITHVDENFITETGYNPRIYNYDAILDTVFRKGYTRLHPMVSFYFKNKPSSNIDVQSLALLNETYINTQGKITETLLTAKYIIQFRPYKRFEFALNYNYNNLLYNTDLLNNGNPLPVDTYKYFDGGITFSNGREKKLYFSTSLNYGEFYHGNKFSLELNSIFRIQPFLKMTFRYNYHYIDFKHLGIENVHLVGLHSEIACNKNTFWTTNIQYNTQLKNISFNSIFQWKYKPLSDFYIVFTDNMDSNNFIQKDYGIMVKLTYWLDI